MPHDHPRGDRALLWIGGYKLCQGLLLIVAATGILTCVHGDLPAIVENWITRLHFNPDNRAIASLLDKLDLVTDRQLMTLSGFSFLYAAIFLAEGVGLMFRQRWAEYLTVIATASLIPFELYEVLRHFGPIKLSLLTLNLAIVVFLLRVLKRTRPEPPLPHGLPHDA